MGLPGAATVLGIQSNGNVKGCLSLPDEFIEGNIRKIGLKRIWENEKSFAYTRRFKKENLKGKCRKCRYGHVCKGGCTDMAFSSTGEINNNPYCIRLIEKGE